MTRSKNGSNDVDRQLCVPRRSNIMKVGVSQMRADKRAQVGELCEAPAASEAALNWVCLGTLRPGGRAGVGGVLKVPVEAGNGLQEPAGEVVRTSSLS
ncbi:MAG: hypothetical protein V8S24_01175 [Gordonibacter pamelaeae]